MKQQQKKLTAFTLIEVLLVLALSAAVAVGALSLYRKRTVQIKIEKTALQFQQWLQAGQLFYVQNHHWPADTEMSRLLQWYLPTHSEKNPWGYPYEIEAVVVDEEETNQNVFRVITTVPGDVFYRPSMVAQRIAALLPNASVKNLPMAKTERVYAEVTIPQSQGQAREGMRILSINYVNLPNIVTNKSSDGSIQIAKPTEAECPRATNEPHIYYSFSGLELNNMDYYNKVRQKTKYFHTAYANTLSEDAAAWQVNIATKAFLNNSFYNHSGRLLVIKTCEAKSTPLVASAAKDDHILF